MSSFRRAGERFAREASIFDSALAEVLPLGALLNQIEARLGRTLQLAPELSKDLIEAGLQALAAADLEGALYVWSSSGDVAAVAAAVRARREPFANDCCSKRRPIFASSNGYRRRRAG